VSRAFSRDEVRETVVPVYMGLVKQIDDQLDLLFLFLEERGLMDKTMIVLTSDHGDYLGDHWLGEKDLFHDPSVKVPLLVYDPAPDAARGLVCDELVEAIDLLPTFLDWHGVDPASQSHRLEGRSLLPWLRGPRPPSWRDQAFSEYDYSILPAAARLGVPPAEARLFMVVDRRWKYVHAVGFRPMLFDLANDPQELVDLGESPTHVEVRAQMATALAQWGLRLSQRTTRSDAQVESMRGASERRGILIGVWDESDVPAELWSGYLGRDR
jgi:arylsulfatase A-like enzyme